MIALTDYHVSHKQITNSLEAAASPRVWQNTFSASVKKSFAVLHCYRWLKEYKTPAPSLQQTALLGDCLGQILSEPSDESTPARPAPTFKRAFDTGKENTKKADRGSFKSGSKVASKSEGRSVDNKKIKAVDAGPKTDAKKVKQLSQILNQQKTASVTSLQEWTKRDGKDHKHSNTPRNIKALRKNTNPIASIKKNDHKAQSKILTKLPNSSKAWQQHITNCVRNVVGQTQNLNDPKNKLGGNSSIIGEISKTALWQKTLLSVGRQNSICTQDLQDLISANPATSGVATLLKQKTILQEKASLPLSEFSHHSSLLSDFPLQNELKKNLQQKSTKASNHSHNESNFGEVAQNPQAECLRSADTLQNTRSTSSKQEFLSKTPDIPEFPPLSKMINKQLQASGKRTALKSESQLLPEHEHVLDDEQLAEALKRIIDQQARRHGINV